MKTIVLSGVIGWDIFAGDIRRQLAEAGSEEVEVQISSPGGFVYDGLEIYNLLRRHPGGVTTRLMGLAASMASYIALAGKRVVAESNAVYMIHNPWALAIGDHREMEKQAEVLEGLAGMLARAYAQKSGRSVQAVRSLMDEETYLFGEEAVEAGFVDELADSSGPEESREASVALARAQVEGAKRVLHDIGEAEDLEKVAALLGGSKRVRNGGVASDTAGIAANLKQGRSSMTKDDLQKEHPDLYAEVYNAGREEARSELAEAESHLEALTNKVEGLEKANAQLSADLAAERAAKMAERKERTLTAALKDGRVKPVDADFWSAQFDKDPEGTEAILAKMPPDPNFAPVGTGAGGTEGALTAEDIARYRKMGVTGTDAEIQAKVLGGRG